MFDNSYESVKLIVRFFLNLLSLLFAYFADENLHVLTQQENLLTISMHTVNIMMRWCSWDCASGISQIKVSQILFVSRLQRVR